MAERISDGIKYSAFTSGEDIILIDSSTTIFEKANLFIRDTLKEGLDENSFIIGYALLCGNSDYVQSQVFDTYRQAGVAHIFAVSGLHIGFVALVLRFLLKRLKINPYVKVLIIVLGLLFYSGICGFSASSLRATVMYGTLLFSSCMGERYDGLSSLSFAFIIILLINPLQLYCAGFILSFTVVFGITILSKPIANLFKFLPKKLASAIGLVLSAQVFSMPACILLFNSFSLVSVLINLVLVPIVGVIFIILIACTLIGGIFSISAITLFVQSYVLQGVDYAINFFDYSVFMVGGLVIGGFAIFYYLSLITASGLINLKIKLRASLSILFALIFLIGTIVLTVSENKTSKVYVLGSTGLCAVVIDTPTEDYMVVNNFTKNFSINRVQSLSSYHDIHEIEGLYITNNMYGIDVNSLMTKLNSVLKINNVYFAKPRDEIELSVLKKSFKKTQFFACGSGGEYLPQGLPITFGEKGYLAQGKINDYAFACFGSMGNTFVSVNQTDREYNLVVGYDYLERINLCYQNQTIISYINSNQFTSAQNNGTVRLKIS
jgi:ComEC/Rec2-related protein